jgi:hypothetical protein
MERGWGKVTSARMICETIACQNKLNDHSESRRFRHSQNLETKRSCHIPAINSTLVEDPLSGVLPNRLDNIIQKQQFVLKKVPIGIASAYALVNLRDVSVKTEHENSSGPTVRYKG